MSPHRREMCFICDSEAINKYICLSIEKTYFTKTAFPTKIGQLLGDDFIVVVSEDDIVCARCASLINRSDKLEMDLLEIKNLITGFLKIKYNFKKEEEQSFTLEGLQHSNQENEDDSEEPANQSDLSQNVDIKSVLSRNEFKGSSKLIDDVRNSEVLIKSALEQNIKSEPNQGKCSVDFDSLINKDNLSSAPITDDFSSDLPEDGSCDRKLSASPGLSVQQTPGLIVSEVKVEKPSDYNNTAFPLTCDQEEIVLSTSQQRDKVSVPNCVASSDAKHKALVIDVKPFMIPNKSGESFGVATTEIRVPEEKSLKNDAEKRDSGKESIAKTKSVRNVLNKPNHKIPPARKLRPILPKLTDYETIVAPFCIIDNSSQGNIIEICNPESTNDHFILANDATIECSSPGIPQDCGLTQVNVRVSEEDESNEIEEEFCEAQVVVNEVDISRAVVSEKAVMKTDYVCSFCQKVFKTKHGLRNHEVRHTGKYSFYCDYCGHGFTSRGKLEEHRICHTKEERFVCDVCGKKFSFQSTYWIHRKWHDNPLPYKCNECGRFFKHSSLLAVHRRKHTGERPYKCSYCPLTFVVGSSLKRHLILHTKDFPFFCTSCKQGFTTRCKYSDHMAKMHCVNLDRPAVEKKDLKVAVYDDVIENDIVTPEQTIVEPNSDETSVKDPLNSIHIISDEFRDSVVEIVLEPSSLLSDHSLSLSDGWLT